MSIETPCIKTCSIDPASGVCRGCGRTLDEIAGWSGLTDAERRSVMERLRAGAERPSTDGAAGRDSTGRDREIIGHA